MRFNYTVAALTFVLMAPGAVAAQGTSQTPLNTVELRQLVERQGPGDAVRLGRHFVALGDRYAAEARRHNTMAKSFEGNPSRSLGLGMKMHCQTLADLAERSAATVRQLAVFHDPSLADVPAARPGDAAKFEAGAGAPSPTETELNAIAARASTASDHQVLERYFREQTSRYLTEAKQHESMAQSYRGTRIASAAVHHDRLADLARQAAKEATAAAAMHGQSATSR
jgi:hypothetical protein